MIPNMKRSLVMKFGGASVATPAHFKKIVDIILSRKEKFDQIIVVVSAMANATNQLIALAKEVNPNPPSREYDMLVSVGERISISLLAMAIAARGEEAVSFTGSQSGIITSEHHASAKIVDVKPKRLLPLLDAGKIVIVAGFQGCSRGGEITTLGRNGSDISAVALGIALQAQAVHFFKDVAGIYEQDPKVNPESALIPEMTYSQARTICEAGGAVLHSRCLDLAEKNGLPLAIYSFDTPDQVGTHIVDPLFQIPKSPLYEEEMVYVN